MQVATQSGLLRAVALRSKLEVTCFQIYHIFWRQQLVASVSFLFQAETHMFCDVEHFVPTVFANSFCQQRLAYFNHHNIFPESNVSEQEQESAAVTGRCGGSILFQVGTQVFRELSHFPGAVAGIFS